MDNTKRYFLVLLNFLNLGIGMEKVHIPKTVETNIDSFILFIRSFEIMLYFAINYVIIKGIQFIISLLAGISMREIPLVYFVAPLLLLLELGLSKQPFNDLKGIFLLVLRVSLKFSIFYGIDKLIV